MFSSRKQVTSSRPSGQISRENIKLYKRRSRYVRVLHAHSQVAERRNNIKVVPAPRSHRAGIWFNNIRLCERRFFFMKVSFFGSTSERRTESTGRGRIVGTRSYSSCATRRNVHVHGVLQARHGCAMASVERCGAHTHGHRCYSPLGLFSESGSMQRLRTRQLDSSLKCLQNPETHWRRAHYKTSCVVGPSLLDVTNL